ncbi:Uncharacterised protein [Vibrio cholerae]|nr:Uncharacterised protein [Vibrio cholerae]CSI59354.1 Uncharacterised protein [Vibrio cholerae]
MSDASNIVLQIASADLECGSDSKPAIENSDTRDMIQRQAQQPTV